MKTIYTIISYLQANIGYTNFSRLRRSVFITGPWKKVFGNTDLEECLDQSKTVAMQKG